MSKEADINFLNIQTFVLKLSIHCDGCKKKVKRLLHKIEGVYTTSIDAEQGKVIVTGNVDPATIIKKFAKAGKPAELLTQKGGNNSNSKTNSNSNQPQKAQAQNAKGQQKDNGKPQKGGNGNGGNGGGGKDQKPQQPQLTPQLTPQQQLQQMKGFKDLQLPQLKDFKMPPSLQKDQIAVNFNLPPKNIEVFDDEYDFDDYDDDEDLDDLDGFDDDFDDDFKNIKIVEPNPNSVSGKKGGGGGSAKKGEVLVENKNMGNGKDAKIGNGGSGKTAGNGGNQNPQGGGGGKNGGGDNKNGGNQNKGHNNANGGNGNGKGNNNNNNQGNGAKKGNGKNGNNGGGGGDGNSMPHPNMMNEGFPGIAMGHKVGNMPVPIGQMANNPAAIQGLPAGGAPPGCYPGGMPAPPGCFPGGMPAPSPEMIAAANPYQQQQYMAALMQQQQQQQRMMMMNAPQNQAFHPMMGYARPPLQPMPMYYNMPPPPHHDPHTSFFSDEDTSSSCSIM